MKKFVMLAALLPFLVTAQAQEGTTTQKAPTTHKVMKHEKAKKIAYAKHHKKKAAKKIMKKKKQVQQATESSSETETN